MYRIDMENIMFREYNPLKSTGSNGGGKAARNSKGFGARISPNTHLSNKKENNSNKGGNIA
jgi:hypothetical protein